MTLRILIAGRERYCAPYDPTQRAAVDRAIIENMDALRSAGRVVAFIQDGNVCRLITPSF